MARSRIDLCTCSNRDHSRNLADATDSPAGLDCTRRQSHAGNPGPNGWLEVPRSAGCLLAGADGVRSLLCTVAVCRNVWWSDSGNRDCPAVTSEVVDLATTRTFAGCPHGKHAQFRLGSPCERHASYWFDIGCGTGAFDFGSSVDAVETCRTAISGPCSRRCGW